MDQNLTPYFSIIITIYNGALTIEETLISIYNQNCKDFELLIYNDGSIDNTNLLLSELQSRYKFKYFNHSRTGRIELLNLGLKQACGKYICICDCDDIWHPSKLEFQHDFFENNKNIKFVSTLSNTFTKLYKFDTYTKYETNIIKKLPLWIYNRISHSSICFENGLFVYPKETIHDYYIYLTLIHKNIILFEIQSVLTYNRIHANQKFESGGWSYRKAVLSMQINFMFSHKKYIYAPLLFFKLLYYLFFAKYRRFYKSK